MAINKLTDVAFRKIKTTDTEQLLSDGGGLYVRVRSSADGGAISFRSVLFIESRASSVGSPWEAIQR